MISEIPRLELRIAAGNHRCRIVFHDNIGIDAMSFDDVFPSTEAVANSAQRLFRHQGADPGQ